MSAAYFPGVKWPGRGVDQPPTSSAEVKKRVEVYLYSPSGLSWPVLGRTLPFPLHREIVEEDENEGAKGKAVPLQAWSGPEGSRKLRFPNYMTMAQDGGKVVSLTHRPPLPPGNAHGIHFC
jgi:hypothetical protein